MTFGDEKALIRHTSGAMQTSGTVHRCWGGCGALGGHLSSSDVKFPADCHANTELYAKPGFNFALLQFWAQGSRLLVLIC